LRTVKIKVNYVNSQTGTINNGGYNYTWKAWALNDDGTDVIAAFGTTKTQVRTALKTLLASHYDTDPSSEEIEIEI
jgi:hypothetical protein